MKVLEIIDEGLIFDNGYKLISYHMQDCCEHHYLDTSYLGIKDFEGLEFDLTNDNFFRQIDDYGIELIPVKGWSIKIPGYGYNNGYYSSELILQLILNEEIVKEYDITSCQKIKE
jgi:hypothetical protein